MQEEIAQNDTQSIGAFVMEVVKIFVMAAIIILPIRLFLFQPFFVQGASMEPNFHDGEYLIVNEVGYKTTKIKIGEKEFFTVIGGKLMQRGEVVVFRYPQNPKQYFIKRIVGLPGERVLVQGSGVKIFNDAHPEGTWLDESYLPDYMTTNGDDDVVVGEDEYFVLGDNRHFSSDSRTWGMLPRDLVVGKVYLRAWPFDKIQVF